MRIYMIAGESSGDAHGAVLMREIARLVPGVQFFGAGGLQMKKIAQGNSSIGPRKRSSGSGTWW